MADLDRQLEALRLEPASEAAASALREAAVAAEAWQLYAEAFVERGDALFEANEFDAACAAWIEAAVITEEHGGELARAAELYERVIDINPDDRRALFSLGLVLHDQQRWDDLIALYRARLERSEDEAERTTLHQYIAELLAEKKDDPDGGFEALMEAARRAPWNLRVLARLEHLGQRTGRLEEVAIAIGDMLMHQEDPKLRAALSLHLGEMHLGPLEDPKRALAHLRAALADDGANPNVLAEIEDFFRERSRFDELAAFLEEVIEDRRIGPHRVRLQRELARIYEHELDDAGQALEALGRALECVPQDRELIDEVLRVGAAQPKGVARIFEGVLTKVGNPLLATFVRLKLGQLYATELDQPDNARRVFQAVLEVDPEHEEARRQLDNLAESVSSVAKDATLVTEASDPSADEGLAPATPEAEPPPPENGPDSEADPEDTLESETPFEEVGLQEALALPEDDIDIDEDVTLLADAPEPPEAETQDLPPQSSTREPRTPASGSPQRSAPLAAVEAAALELVSAESDLVIPFPGPRSRPPAPANEIVPTEDEPLDAPPETNGRWLLDDEPLEEVRGFPIPEDDLDEPLSAEVMVVLEAPPAREDLEAPLEPGVPADADPERDPDAVVEAVDEAMAVAERVKEVRAALAASRGTPPSNGLADIVPLSGRSEPLEAVDEAASLDVLEAQLELLEGEERTEALLSVARSARAVGDEDRAERLLRLGLHENRSHPELLIALTELMEAAHRWPEWLELCDRRLELLDPLEASTERLRMVEVARTEMRDLPLAWRLAETAAAAEETDPRPWAALAELAREADEPEALAEVLDRRARIAPEEALKPLGEALLAMGAPGRAAEAWERAVGLDPLDHELRVSLATLWLELDQPERAERHLVSLAERGPADVQATAWLRLAEQRLGVPGEEQQGEQALERALHLAPERPDVLALASDSAARAGDPSRASRLAEQCAEQELESAARAAWFRRAGQLADEAVGDTRRALSLYEKALESDPDDPEVEARLGAILVERNQPARAHPHLARAADGLRDDERSAELFEAAGRAAESAGDEPAARAAFRSALERVSTRKVALLRAAALEERAGRVDAAHDLSASLLLYHGTSLTEAEQAEVQLRLARAKQARGDIEGAARLAGRARRIEPDALEPLALHAELLEALSDPEAPSVLKRLAGRQPPGSARAQALARAAAQVSDASAAELARRAAWLEEALSEDPAHVQVAVALAEAREQAGERERAADVLEAALPHAPAEEAAALATRAAELVRTLDRPRARELLARALSARPAHPAAVDAREVMLALDGRAEARAELLVGAAQASSEPAEAERWRLTAASVFETQLASPGRALGLLPRHEDPDRYDDLVFARAVETRLGVEEAIHAWVERCLRAEPEPLAFLRVEQLMRASGAVGPARYLLELRSALFGVTLPEGAPTPAPLPGASAVPEDPDDVGGEDRGLRDVLGHALVEAFRTELPGAELRRRDALGASTLPLPVNRAIDAAAEALGVTRPPVYAAPIPGERPIEPGYAAGAPSLFVAAVPPDEDEVGLRYWAGRALGLLRPSHLGLALLSPTGIRHALHGLGEVEPWPGDTDGAKSARRRGRALFRVVPSERRGRAADLARNWCRSRERRSLIQARAVIERTGARLGLAASGSPLAALARVGRLTPEGVRLLRFAVEATSYLG